jgi:hypothetical protein
LIDSYKLILVESRNACPQVTYFINARIQLLQIYSKMRRKFDSASILLDLASLRDAVETDALGLLSLSLLFEVNVLAHACESDAAIEEYVLEKASINLFRAQGALDQLKIILFATSEVCVVPYT